MSVPGSAVSTAASMSAALSTSTRVTPAGVGRLTGPQTSTTVAPASRAAEHKIKKTTDTMELAMQRTTDVLATVAARTDRPFVVGFAAETEAVEQNARTKLMKKNLDMIAANEVGHDKAFDCEDNQLIVLSRNGRHELGRAGKLTLARGLVSLIAGDLAARAGARTRGTALA